MKALPMKTKLLRANTSALGEDREQVIDGDIRAARGAIRTDCPRSERRDLFVSRPAAGNQVIKTAIGARRRGWYTLAL